MNATVTRIVDILFEDAEMNDENRALHDEIMRNCQDRFDDLMAQGKTEDDAIAVVVDSLKGMEDVIGTKPRHRESAESDDNDEDDDMQTLRVPADQVQVVRVDLRNEDVTLTAIDGDMVTVSWDKSDNPLLTAGMDGDALVVHLEDAGTRAKGKTWRFGDWFSVSLSHFAGGDVTIGIPASYAGRAELHTMSGDLSVTLPELREAALTSTSGDVSVEVDVPMTRLTATTASGDLHVSAPVRQAALRSMSGDLTYEGSADDLDATSVSGEVSVEGRIVTAQVKSVSGDVRFTAEDDRIVRVKATTTSGDVDVRLPASISAVNFAAKSVSGDVHSAFPDHGAASPVTVEASSVSGDVRVR